MVDSFIQCDLAEMILQANLQFTCIGKDHQTNMNGFLRHSKWFVDVFYKLHKEFETMFPNAFRAIHQEAQVKWN